jgi:ABC-2 type transport system ATP-binding protein
MLMDFARPTSGDLSVFGLDPQADVVEVHQRIGYVSDEDMLMPTLTGRECLEYQIRMKDADEDPDDLLELVGLQEAATKQTNQYSTGMKQRLEVALAIVGQPDLLVLDEPFTGLDPHGVKLVREVVEHENDRGATVLISSHQLDQVGRLCDRIGILSGGRLVNSGTIDQLCADSGLSVELQVELATSSADLAFELDTVRGVESVKRNGSMLQVTAESGACTDELQLEIRDRGGEIDAIEIDQPSVEKLFVDLTREDVPTEE